jgi:hypothetical protein
LKGKKLSGRPENGWWLELENLASPGQNGLRSSERWPGHAAFNLTSTCEADEIRSLLMKTFQ